MIEYIQLKQDEYCLTTSEFAALNGIKAETIRERICKTGSYFGVRPRKLASRRLLFPAVQVSIVQGGEK